MKLHRNTTRRTLLGATAIAGALALTVQPAAAQTPQQQYDFNIPVQPLSSALRAYGVTADQQIVFTDAELRGRMAPPVQGSFTADEALQTLLAGTGLHVHRRDSGLLQITAAADPQGGSAAGGGAEVEALIVTAQKREEDIQDVPIAISAFSQEDLTTRQVAGGPDLITQIPNMSFTKTNFTGYSIQIRGIGTQAISATTDPAVAVAFNNTPFIRNRFFEQEFYDLERLEVLRGPQGTLYGRNATAGVVNLISGKPKFFPDAKVSADLGNYANQRVEGMVNIPLVEDAVALRIAGAWTKRDGYATNEMTGKQIDGRDLWSTRVSLRFEPNDWISANFIWEHFQEDDDRLRSGKQLCKRHEVTEIGGLPVAQTGGFFASLTYLSQGCEASSLYSPEAFQTPNGFALPYHGPLSNLGLPVYGTLDPYRSSVQSRDLRVIESTVEPEYRANADIAQLQVSIDLSESLTLSSETAYSADSLFSLQDYNRFTTATGTFQRAWSDAAFALIDPDGFYCDPQLGCSDRMLLVDLSTSESTQFSQEFRLGSDFDGPFNFSLGVNYLRHDAEDKYYVFVNTLSLWGEANVWTTQQSGNDCLGRAGAQGDTAQATDPTLTYGISCVYVDPNPIGSLNDQGRNYFLSKNPYKLISYAAFGEAYYNITPDLKLTGGLRFTVDRKTAPQIPSWLLVANAVGPYPTLQTLEQEWREPTGRLAIDWKPDLGFTDDTLLYASYAHGYKAGGANPPPPVFSTYTTFGAGEVLPDTFDPEFIDAFEVGTKNTLFDGAVTMNLAGFYYDYKGYQISEIRNRSAVNSNFDAEVWGAEIEVDWRITEALRLGVKGGYQKTRVADGSGAIDLMDRTAGKEGWIVLRPFPSVPSNCIMPLSVMTAGGVLHAGGASSGRTTYNGLCIDAYVQHLDPITLLPYVPDPTHWRVISIEPIGGPVPMPAAYDDYPGFNPDDPQYNGGKGFTKDLSGNELPNAPDYTLTVTADYTVPLAGEWMLTLHGDYHYQSESWARIFNSDPYDYIKAFSTVNLSAIFTNEDAGWKVMAYVKNVFDETAITGAFLNSDDSGLTTNVFLTEPRLYGVRVTKGFTGMSGFWGFGDGQRRAPGEPSPFQVEIGAQISRFDGSAAPYAPDWVTPALVGAGGLAVQDNDLDWGDIRDIKLTYAPATDWRISASYLYGRTNGQGRGAAYEDVPNGVYVQGGITWPVDRDNHLISAVRDAEEHAIADFMIGKDVGLGVFGEGGKSTISAGLRYANLKSRSSVLSDGITETSIDPLISKYEGLETYNVFTATLDSAREFEGVGPAVSWESSIRLVGDDASGHVSLDWKVGGGVLFGRQTVDSSEDRIGTYYYEEGGPLQGDDFETVLHDDVIQRRRAQDATVPNLSLSLGLSYRVDRFGVSAGYRWERYFDAIDGGYAEPQQYDRTIDGPYFKLAIGFGG